MNLSWVWMAVKNLKIIVQKIFLTLTDQKVIFLNFKSVSVTTRPPSFLLQSKIIWLFVLCSNYRLYDFNVTRFKFFLKSFCIFSYFWFFLNFYHIILTLISPIGFEKTFKRSLIKILEKSLWFKWFRHILLAFFYWIFGFFSGIWWLIMISWWLPMHDNYAFSSIQVYARFELVFWLPLKAFEVNVY